jgi:hypothetical protein
MSREKHESSTLQCLVGASDMDLVKLAGEITAQEALREALLNIKAACSHIKSTFQTEVAEKREELANTMEP